MSSFRQPLLRSTPRPSLLATGAALAGLAALGAALLVGPSTASPLPTKAAASQASAETLKGPAVVQGASSSARAAAPMSEVASQPSSEAKRPVRVVYVGPITAK